MLNNGLTDPEIQIWHSFRILQGSKVPKPLPEKILVSNNTETIK